MLIHLNRYNDNNSPMKTLLLLTSVHVFFSSCTQSTNPLGTEEDITSAPLIRNAHTLAYHDEDSTVYLFGGANHKEVLGDTWAWKGKEWTMIESQTSPEPRTFPAFCYDDKNDRLILFGGSKVLFGKSPDPNNLLNDTWQFMNNQWEQLPTEFAPIPRAEAVMVYDKSNENIVLFGGYQIEGNDYVKLGDTWVFQNDTWTLVSETGPSSRHGVAMAYDPNLGGVILFGGSTIDKQYGEGKGETWKWDGENWSKLEIDQPGGVFNATMVYDEIEQGLIRFGGYDGKNRIDQTWLFRNNRWTQLILDKLPEPRNHSSMIYDKNSKQVILFGGHNGKEVFGDLWQFKNREWEKVIDLPPVKRLRNRH